MIVRDLAFLLKKTFEKLNKKPLIINRSICSRRPKVLISYLEPFLYLNRVVTLHSNVNDYIEIIDSFISAGYELHLASCNYSYSSECYSEKFDVIFGLGQNFIKFSKKNPSAKKILYCTESSPDFSYKMEKERVDLFNKTASKKVDVCRSGVYLTNEMINLSDALVIIGNDHVKNTYDTVLGKKIITGVYPSALINSGYKIQKNNIPRNIIWFGSTGVVHKGLHIAIEAMQSFKNLKLYVAGASRKELKSLRLYNNVVCCDRLDVNSSLFVDVIQHCSAFILPSCSEAGSSATITCLSHGLYPLVPREVGVDLPYGLNYLHSCSVIDVINAINEYLDMDDRLLFEMRNNILSWSIDKFNIKAFRHNMANIISKFDDIENNQ